MNAVSRLHQGVAVVDLPGLRLENPLNGSHLHWAAAAKRRARIRGVVLMAVRSRARDVPLPIVVTITRIANSDGLDPHDGLPASCKPVIDAIADAYGIDDRDSRVTWRHEQRRGKAYGCEIRLEAAREAPAVAIGPRDALGGG